MEIRSDHMIRNVILFLAVVLSVVWAGCGGDKTKQAVQDAGPDPELALLTQQLEQNPENDSLLFRRAEVYYNLEGYDEALRDLSQAIRLDSLQPQYYHLLADVLLDYARPNDSKRAIDVLLTAAHLFPGRAQTLLKLSEFQLIVQQHTEALATLDKILQQDPQNSEAYFMAGRVALDMGDTTRAISSLQKSAQLNADNAEAWRFLGRIFTQRNNPLAIRYFDNALRVDSTDLESREYKAVYYKLRGEFDKAFDIYRDIIIRNPDYSNAYFDMGAIYLEMDSLQQAYEHFNLAVRTDPLFVKAYFFRGHTSELMGNLDAARADYLQASKMSPNYPEPKAALERLGSAPQ
ncbi:MAG: tetratricopeptide repeat protein [Bacteroidetes bacterium]|nr:MAG: tetratricopeptide repeat protein [Bacteroidota bacterium]